MPNWFGFLECALELGAEYVVSGDSDLLELGSFMGIPILTPRAFLEEIGEIPRR
jgi:predicted nucleic acid-binding protein